MVFVMIVGTVLIYRLWRHWIQQEMELTQFKTIFSELRARDNNRTLSNLIDSDRLAAALEAGAGRMADESESQYQQYQPARS